MSELPALLVVMALAAESDGVFEAAGVPVLYCGVGKVNAAVALTRELRRYVHAGARLPSVVNFGCAGRAPRPRARPVVCVRPGRRGRSSPGGVPPPPPPSFS